MAHFGEETDVNEAADREIPSDTVRRFWEEVWTGGQVDVLTDILGPRWTENGEPSDVGAFQRGVTAWREVFPDFSATVEEVLTIGEDRVVSRVTYRGTHSGSLWGLEATGAHTEVVGVDLFRVEDGRITELWHAVDHLELVLQVGGVVKPGGRLGGSMQHQV
ncbi:MAG: ester cyclase [Mycobacteriales bacterium]|nr:ester cyclase [Mycobacteriales bacterium]